LKYKKELKRRVSGVRDRMTEDGVDVLLVAGAANIRYLTGFDVGRIVLTSDDAILWVKDLYRKIHVRQYGGGFPFDVRDYEKGVVEDHLKKYKKKRVGVENLPIQYIEKMRKAVGGKPSVVDYVEAERAVKSKMELLKIKKACRIGTAGMNRAHEVVRCGVPELDAVSEIEYTIRKMGSETPPFNDGMLLASGAHAANIHARAGSRPIRRGLVVVDLGARFGGYYSDLTRTIGVGKLTAEEEELVGFVECLRDDAISRVRPGMKASDLHAFVEEEIKKRGFKFYHSTGHGIGLEVHEKPNIESESKDVLEEGMVFTVEPGIYVPKKYGIRFEDTVLLTNKGAKVLTRK